MTNSVSTLRFLPGHEECDTPTQEELTILREMEEAIVAGNVGRFKSLIKCLPDWRAYSNQKEFELLMQAVHHQQVEIAKELLERGWCNSAAEWQKLKAEADGKEMAKLLSSYEWVVIPTQFVDGEGMYRSKPLFTLGLLPERNTVHGKLHNAIVAVREADSSLERDELLYALIWLADEQLQNHLVKQARQDGDEGMRELLTSAWGY